MPASLEIRIEEVAPLELALRAAGRMLGEQQLDRRARDGARNP